LSKGTSDIGIELQIRQQELAGLVKIGPTALNSILLDLREKGHLKTDYARMTILDPAGLRVLLSA